MYKYQCSRQDCGSSWTLQEGCLNGFVLTCPICNKGRGIFVSQSRRQLSIRQSDKNEPMTITIGKIDVGTKEFVIERLEGLRKNYSLDIVENGYDINSNKGTGN